jgi:hypothetical protein
VSRRCDVTASPRRPRRAGGTATPPAPWQEPSAADRCTAAVAAVTKDIFTWHRRGVTVRMVEPGGHGGVRLGISGLLGVDEAQELLDHHYGFPVACYVWA